MHNATHDSKTYNRWFIISLLVAMGILSQFASDNFLPSLPAISKDLSASTNLTKMTISIYLAGLFISQLVYGPLGDSKGRRPIIFIGTGIFGVGSIICLFAPNIYILLLGRFVQGLGIGASSALFRAIMRDCFQGVELARTGAYLSIVFAIIPAIAPVTGGYIQAYLGWRYNFGLCLLLLIIIGAYLYFYLPETLPKSKRKHRRLTKIIQTYFEIFTNKVFILNTLCSCLAYSALMIYLTISPFLFQHVIGLTPVQFGWLMPLTALSFLLGGIANSRLMYKYGLIKIMQTGGILQLLTSLIMLLFGFLGYLNLYIVLIPVMIFIFANAFIFANSFAGAFEPFPHIAGFVGALFASLQMLSASSLSTIAAIMPAYTQKSLAFMLVLTALGINFSLQQLKRCDNHYESNT